MPIKVVLADDSDIIREAIRRLLKKESRIEIVGEASTFPAAMEMVAAFKPHILLLDLSMPQKHDFLAPAVKSQLNCVQYTLAMSFSNDGAAKSLGASYGAAALLDKTTLYSQLVPAIVRLSEAPPNYFDKLDLK